MRRLKKYTPYEPWNWISRKPVFVPWQGRSSMKSYSWTAGKLVTNHIRELPDWIWIWCSWLLLLHGVVNVKSMICRKEKKWRTVRRQMYLSTFNSSFLFLATCHRYYIYCTTMQQLHQIQILSRLGYRGRRNSTVAFGRKMGETVLHQVLVDQLFDVDFGEKWSKMPNGV